LGYSLEQLLQMDYWELAHPDFRELIRSRGLARQAGQQLPARSEFQAITGRGETLWLECVARRTEYAGRPAVLGAAFDVTARREAQEALRALLDAMPDGMFRIRNDGTLLDCKVNAPENLALPVPQPRGRNLAEVWPAPLVELTLHHVHSALRSLDSQRFEFRYSGREQDRHYEARVVASGPDEALVIIRDFSEQRRLEHEVLRISGREQERIGKDLHDDVGQLLTGLGFLAQALQQQLTRRGLAEAADAAQINQLAARALKHTRVLARGLFPVELASKGLFVALQQLAQDVQTLFKITCSVRWNSPLHIRDSAVAEHLYRLVQEAISNAIKHGHASRISIQFRAGRGQPALIVRDNGGLVCPPSEPLRGMGLRIMDYRARRIGATVAIRAVPRGGTVVTCSLPPSALHPKPL
jgi:signal transduction histidine kinase